MANSPKETEGHLKSTVTAWRSLRPIKKFLGLTVEEFPAELKPALDARDAVNEAEARLTGAISAVKADATDGANNDVLEAIGYVIPSKRKSGLHRKANTIALPEAA